jgi:hypothetical protein
MLMKLSGRLLGLQRLHRKHVASRGLPWLTTSVPVPNIASASTTAVLVACFVIAVLVVPRVVLAWVRQRRRWQCLEEMLVVSQEMLVDLAPLPMRPSVDIPAVVRAQGGLILNAAAAHRSALCDPVLFTQTAAGAIAPSSRCYGIPCEEEEVAIGRLGRVEEELIELLPLAVQRLTKLLALPLCLLALHVTALW